MSTRANIVIHDPKWNQHIMFYRHSDGYPEGVKETLDKFVSMLKTQIRSNVEQSAGWLILLGAQEYDYSYDREEGYKPQDSTITELIENGGWKVGAYEPATGIHGDIEHLYIIDLDKKEWFEIGENASFEHLQREWEKYRDKHRLEKALN